MDKGEIYIHSELAPICSNDGFYGKLQFHKQNINKKYCSNRQGEMIESFEGSVDTLMGRKMNCECALARYHLTQNKPTCCANGNYESMRCFSGMCYCVDEFGRQVGEETEQTNSPNLPCDPTNSNRNRNDFCCESEDPYSTDDWCFETSLFI